METPPASWDLPADLVTFLSEEKQLEYDASVCEAGAVRLFPLPELKLQQFPVETGPLPCRKQDPHYPGLNSYLVPAVDLVAGCGDMYEPVGLLLWLPVERRFGIWDSTHCGIQIFGARVTWQHIAAAPARHINAGWTGMDPEAPAMEDLVPWPAHPYGDAQVYEPQPA